VHKINELLGALLELTSKEVRRFVDYPQRIIKRGQICSTILC